LILLLEIRAVDDVGEINESVDTTRNSDSLDGIEPVHYHPRPRGSPS
jgi:hypothetical protein